MCIIAIKPKGVDMPSDTYIENMWYHNHDGAGYMYATGKKVVIEKGFMSLDAFRKSLKELGEQRSLKDTSIVMHFRIGTAGGNTPANTHPFPITDSIPVMQKLSCSTQLGIVHNGIINITVRRKDISDTMEYIASQLAPLYRFNHEFYKSKDLMSMIGNATASKLAFMTPNGEVYTVGPFIEEDGVLYSNCSYSYSSYYRSNLIRAYGLDAEDERLLNDEWNWNVGSNYYTEDLMMLEDSDYIVDMDSGNFYGGNELTFFIDDIGYLYVYDDFEQCAYMVSNKVQAFNKDGLSLKFKDDKAFDMVVSMKEYIDLDELLGRTDDETKLPDSSAENTSNDPF